MKNGDFARLALFQRKYAVVGVKMVDGKHFVYAGNSQQADRENENYEEFFSNQIEEDTIYLRVEADYKDNIDKGTVYYSLNGKEWISVNMVLDMDYSIPHFMGYRFALFYYVTIKTGGYVDFDYFRIGDKLSTK